MSEDYLLYISIQLAFIKLNTMMCVPPLKVLI